MKQWLTRTNNETADIALTIYGKTIWIWKKQWVVDFQKTVRDVSSVVFNWEIRSQGFFISGWFWYDAGKSDRANSSRIEKTILSRKSPSYDAAIPRCLILAVWGLRPGYGTPKIHDAQSNWAPTKHDLQVRKSLYEIYLITKSKLLLRYTPTFKRGRQELFRSLAARDEMLDL